MLVPLQCEFYALEGLSHLMRTIERVRRALNPGLEIQGVVLTMYDRRNNLSDMVAHDVRGYFGDTVLRDDDSAQCPCLGSALHGKPVLLYDLACAGAQAYVRLAAELLKREKRMTA